MRYLKELKLGYQLGSLGVVPIVPGAILMDLGVGNPESPTWCRGRLPACVAAGTGPVAEGNVGADATIGKMFGPQWSMKSGRGTASVKVADTGIIVEALVAVNAVGDVVHPETGKIVAGARSEMEGLPRLHSSPAERLPRGDAAGGEHHDRRGCHQCEVQQDTDDKTQPIKVSMEPLPGRLAISPTTWLHPPTW